MHLTCTHAYLLCVTILQTIARAISDAEGRLKVASRQAASAEVKSDEGGALKADLTSQKLRVAALKERASHAESSYRGILESLSSGKWQVVPKGTVTPETAWGPLSGKQPQLRVDTGSPSSYSHTGQSSPSKHYLKISSFLPLFVHCTHLDSQALSISFHTISLLFP